MSSFLIWSASAIWSSLTAMMRILIGIGILRPARLPGKVISVGNIQAGGAGKTPLVAQIAREARERGLSTCILCRGYGGAWEDRGGLIRPGDAESDPALCGDEAALLHDLAPDAYIGVGADRVAQYEKARKALGRPFDVVLLDDGFQHWRIRKDLELVALTSARRTQMFHRDWGGALKFADLVIWTKGETRPGASGRPMVKARYSFDHRARAEREGSTPLWLVTGLADGKSARGSLECAGVKVDRHIPFPDHARYAEGMVAGILESAKRAGAIVLITGKDWVKWRKLGVAPDQVKVLEPQVVFEEGRDLWLRVLWGESP